MQSLRQELTEKFAKVFGDSQGVSVYFAPGRVNLIGEHIDYSGGHVFPCALTLGTYGAARRREDDRLRFFSMNFEDQGVIEDSLDNLIPERDKTWVGYPKSVIWAFEKKGISVPRGMDLLLYGTLPNGAGLSSSASVEVLTGFILRDLFGLDVDNRELAILGQRGENEYSGMNCGIMDQFAVAMGKRDSAIFLDTSDLSYEYLPLKLEGAGIVIANSNKKHSLTDSKYNERRRECERALEELQAVIGIDHLCDLDEETFELYQSAIKDEVRRRRARHAVSENQRTIRATEALKGGDIAAFGRLMNESHRSLSEDYEVTGEEMDTLVSAAWQQKGVLGARMTGGGFGGSTVNIVKTEYIDDFIANVGKMYEEKAGYRADFYVVETGDGPCRL